jgi:branched-chain amino acid transport system substrate-binding protein
MMRQSLRGLGVLMLIGGLVAGSGSGVNASTGRTAPRGGGPGGSGTVVKIGWAGPLSGDQAYFGRGWLNGVRLAAQTVRFTGALRGATVEVIPVDDAADPARGVAAARQLVAEGVVGVVADFNSGVTLASEPIYHAAGIPQVTVSSNPAITARGYRNIVQLNENDNFQGGQMAIFARTKLGVQSVAVFNDSKPFGQGVAASFTTGARNQGIAIVGNPTALSPMAQSYTSALTPVLAKHPQAIYFGGTIAPGELLCRQARAAGFAGPFLGPDGLFHPDFVRSCPLTAGAAYVTTSVPPYGSSPALRSFAARYRAQFGGAPGPYSVYGYDEAGFLLAAINAAGRASRPAAVSRLHSITYQGVLGPERINAAGQLLHAPNYVYRVTRNGFVPVYSNRGM